MCKVDCVDEKTPFSYKCEDSKARGLFIRIHNWQTNAKLVANLKHRGSIFWGLGYMVQGHMYIRGQFFPVLHPNILV